MTDEEKKRGLSWATTEELWRELAGRFQSCLLFYDCPGKQQGESHYGVMEKPGGSPIGTLGLAHFAAMMVPTLSQRLMCNLNKPDEGEDFFPVFPSED